MKRLGRALVALCSAGLALAVAVPAGAAPATTVVHLRPVDAQGRLLPGFSVGSQLTDANCQSGSPTIGNAYECVTPQSGRGVYHSCWVETDHSYVVCLVKPWQHRVVRLHVTRGYDDSAGFGTVHRPWGLRVGVNLRCLVILGPTDTTRGNTVRYACNHKTVLAGPIRRGSTWHAHAYRKIHHGSHHLTYHSRGVEPVSTAWFGKGSVHD